MSSFIAIFTIKWEGSEGHRVAVAVAVAGGAVQAVNGSQE